MASLWDGGAFSSDNLTLDALTAFTNRGASQKLQGTDLLTHGVKAPPVNTPTNTWSREGMFGESGWAMPAVQGIGAAASIGLGVMNYREAKKTRKEQTRQFNKNFDMQSNVLEGRIRDRYEARQRMGGSSNYNSADDAVASVMKR